MAGRTSGRAATALREVRIVRGFTRHAEGSVLIECGDTRVLCTASVEAKVPGFLKGSGQGWLTAEYGMLPRSTHTRSDREAARGKQSGRTQEIQRLIGRSLRSVVDLNALGERTITLDCDVLQADGGTRCASITGAFVAACDAVAALMTSGALARSPIRDLVAVFCGKFSTVAIEEVPVIHREKLIMLDPWAAADQIVDNGQNPNFVFRLSLRDGWAMTAILQEVERRRLSRVGVMVPNTAWGRSSVKAAEDWLATHGEVSVVSVQWYNWGEMSLLGRYLEARHAGAEAIVLVANDVKSGIDDIVAGGQDETLAVFLPTAPWLRELTRIVGADITERADCWWISLIEQPPAVLVHQALKLCRSRPIQLWHSGMLPTLDLPST